MTPSKSQIVNVVSIVVMFLTVLLNHEWVAENPTLTLWIGIAVKVLDTWLRTLTNQPTVGVFFTKSTSSHGN